MITRTHTHSHTLTTNRCVLIASRWSGDPCLPSVSGCSLGVRYIGVRYIGVRYIGVRYIGVRYIGVRYIGVRLHSSVGVACLAIVCCRIRWTTVSISE